MKYGFEFTIVQYSGGTVCSIGVNMQDLTDGPFGIKGYNSDFISSFLADSELIGT
ncbi:MAG TPA: hypothetical protein OIL84_05230 [Succinivibrionaceae bacterium]|nr:hypothetical protein [Succinivibrionaceae bacterium]